MGIAGKKRRSEERKRKKRAEKESRRSLYQSAAAAGSNSKEKKLIQRAEGGVKTVSHPYGPCGNVGCARCHPLSARPRGGSHRDWLATQREKNQNS